jgi:hypothetical protein
MLGPLVPLVLASLFLPAITNSPWPLKIIAGVWLSVWLVATIRLMCVRCPSCRRRFYWGWGIGWFFEGRTWRGGLRSSCFHCGASDDKPRVKNSR